MKKIEKKELIEKIIPKYIADDGTEFTDEKECERYERQIALERLSVIETSSEAQGLANFDGGECYESHNYVWYRPKDAHEIDLLKAAYDDEGHTDFSYNMIGQWICVETDCADDFLWVTTIDDGIEYAKDILSKLGYDMVVTAKEEQK